MVLLPLHAVFLGVQEAQLPGCERTHASLLTTDRSAGKHHRHSARYAAAKEHTANEQEAALKEAASATTDNRESSRLGTCYLKSWLSTAPEDIISVGGRSQRTSYYSSRIAHPPCNFTSAFVKDAVSLSHPQYCHISQRYSLRSAADLGGAIVQRRGTVKRCKKMCDNVTDCVGFDITVIPPPVWYNPRRWNLRNESDPSTRAYCALSNITSALPKGSAALTEYLEQVYGRPLSRHEALLRDQEFDWNAVELIWEKYLPPALRVGCKWPCDPDGFGSVFRAQGSAAVVPTGSLWVYRRHRFTSSSGLSSTHAQNAADSRLNRLRLRNARGVRQLTHQVVAVADAGWHEVSHTLRVSEELGWRTAGRFYRDPRAHIRNFKLDPSKYLVDGEYDSATWMYGAVGSGIFYPMRRAVIGRRTRDIVLALCPIARINESVRDKYEAYCGPKGSMGYAKRGNRSFAMQIARDLGYDTMVYTDTEEWASPGYKLEIIGLASPALSGPHRNMTTVWVPAASGVQSWPLPVDRLTRCPSRFTHLAWGWNAQRQPCICDTQQAHIECSKSKTVDSGSGIVNLVQL